MPEGLLADDVFVSLEDFQNSPNSWTHWTDFSLSMITVDTAADWDRR